MRTVHLDADEQYQARIAATRRSEKRKNFPARIGRSEVGRVGVTGQLLRALGAGRLSTSSLKPQVDSLTLMPMTFWKESIFSG
jgi:hypothetical protein